MATIEEQIQARYWLKPGQIDELRNACFDAFAGYLQDRNETLVALTADTGVRVGELTQLTVDMFNADESVLFLPSSIQKQYPNDRVPPPANLELDDETVRRVRSYLNNRWKRSDFLFPSRERPDMTTEAVRNVFRKAAKEGYVKPYEFDKEQGWVRGNPSNVTPHVLRHSVAYRMLKVEEGNTIYDVKNRLRHASVTTTEKIYSHFDTV